MQYRWSDEDGDDDDYLANNPPPPYPGLQASVGDMNDDGDYDGIGPPTGEQMTPAERADAAGAGELDFMGVWHDGFVENCEGTGHRSDSYIFGYEREGYDLQHGYGTEASHPPDYGDPEDPAAYPYGVIYEGDPGFEELCKDVPDDDRVPCA